MRLESYVICLESCFLLSKLGLSRFCLFQLMPERFGIVQAVIQVHLCIRIFRVNNHELK